MPSATSSAPAGARTETPGPWLFGPWTDLAFGCGLAYWLAFGAQAVGGPEMRAWLPAGLLGFLVLATGVPHYGATMLRVFDDPEDRRRHLPLLIGTGAVLAVLLVAGVRVAWIGSLVLTVYLTWSPWHYSAQNFGIAMVLLRRGGVALDPGARRALRAWFVLTYLVTLLAIHGAVVSADYAPVSYDGTIFEFLRIGLPSALRDGGMTLGASAALACLVFACLRSGARLAALGPALAVCALQALWFAIPALSRLSGIGAGVEPLGLEHAAYAFIWIGVAHSVQYLWITSHFARRANPQQPQHTYLFRALLWGTPLWIVPALVLAPGLLGTVPFDMGVWVLVGAGVNLHHFVMDGALWKLRNPRVSGRLFGRAESEATAGPIAQRAARLRPVLTGAGVALGLASVAVWCVGTFEEEFGLRRAELRGDVERLETAQRRLGWIGRESAGVARRLAEVRDGQGDVLLALRHAEWAVAIHEDGETLGVLGRVHASAGECERATEAYERAVRKGPREAATLNNAAWHFATRPGPHERFLLALELAERAHAQVGDRAAVLDTLAAAQASLERYAEATTTAQRAVQAALAEGNAPLAREIAQRARLYANGRAWWPRTPGRC